MLGIAIITYFELSLRCSFKYTHTCIYQATVFYKIFYNGPKIGDSKEIFEKEQIMRNMVASENK